MPIKSSISHLYFSPDVKLYDYIKEEVGARMVDRIYDLTKEIKTAAELGTISIFVRLKSNGSNSHF